MMYYFSRLDFSRQKLIAQFVAQSFVSDLGRSVDTDEVIRLCIAFDVEVEWGEDDSFEIQADGKLEQVVRAITSSF